MPMKAEKARQNTAHLFEHGMFTSLSFARSLTNYKRMV